MCRSSTELLFVFICLFSACKIQASIYALLVLFLYLKLHFIFALYLFIWIFIRIYTLLTFWAQACNMLSVRQVCFCLVFAWVSKNEFAFFKVFFFGIFFEGARRTLTLTGSRGVCVTCGSVTLFAYAFAQKIYTHQCTLTPRYIRIHTHVRTHTHGRTHTHTIAQLE